jgi:hypothetical protein
MTAAITGWLVPGTEVGLAEALRTHAKNRDVAALAGHQSPHLAPAIDAIGVALDAEPQFLIRVPGCGGVHVPSGTIGRNQQVRDELWALAVEAAAFTRHRLVAEMNTTVVTFPRSGIRVRFESVDCRAQLAVDTDGTVMLTHHGRALTLTPTGPHNCLEPSGSEAGLTVEAFPQVAGLRVGGSALTGLGIPDFMKVSVPVSEGDLDGLDRTVRLIGRAAPEVLTELLTIVRAVVPLVPPGGRAIHSSSARELPGVVYAVCTDQFESAAMICHEYHHLKLFLLQERLDLLGRPDVSTRAPWRPDVRKAEGVLHGIYVFFGIASLFDRIFATLAPTRRGLRRLAVWRACVEAGIRELRSVDAQPTEAGAALLDDMDGMNSQAMDRLAVEQVDAVDWARTVIQAHLSMVGTERRQEPWYLLV